MPSELIFLIAALGGFLVAVYSGKVRIDMASLVLMIALVFPWRAGEDGTWIGVLPVAKGFSGFGSTAVVMIVAMFVISAAMERTGAASLLGDRLLRRASGTETGLLVAVVAVVSVFSAVVSDTTSVLVWMPLILATCRERGYNASRLLMPLAFAALLGGQWTLIGTRVNVVVSDFLRLKTGEGLGFLAFTPVALANWACVVVFLLVLGKRLLPSAAAQDSLADRYDVQEYLTEVMATPGAELVGRTLEQLELERDDVTVLGIIRKDEHLPPSPWLVVQPGDVFVVQGRISTISALLARPGIQVKEELVVGDRTLRSVDLRMAEALIAPNSQLEGHSLEELDFHRRHGLSVLAIGRGGKSLTTRPLSERLHLGDSLLLVGHEERFAALRGDPNVQLLETRPLPMALRDRAWVLIALLITVVMASAVKILDPALAIVMGAVGAIVCRCISLRGAYDSVDWRVVIVLGGIIPFSIALEDTGSSQWIAETVVERYGDMGPHAVFAALLLLVTVLTQVVNNTAVAVVLAPVAYQLAEASNSNPVPFLLGTALCASAGFASPMAHECTLLVMGPGGYKMRHYLNLGIPAAVISFLVVYFCVPLLYPL